ncbi:hypothetical protein [Parafrankia sp. CH37]|uniref:hypothetical protein n=1 Tax=Parafrankia sp. CH37 TaxID=683308 RepID=UPI0018669F81|nr:hypothetical protein [Parafrankia sp. CH37]MBE3206745.1 hypothetical protein [Parafrankia sp. CH37]
MESVCRSGAGGVEVAEFEMGAGGAGEVKQVVAYVSGGAVLGLLGGGEAVQGAVGVAEVEGGGAGEHLDFAFGDGVGPGWVVVVGAAGEGVAGGVELFGAAFEVSGFGQGPAGAGVEQGADTGVVEPVTRSWAVRTRLTASCGLPVV